MTHPDLTRHITYGFTPARACSTRSCTSVLVIPFTQRAALPRSTFAGNPPRQWPESTPRPAHCQAQALGVGSGNCLVRSRKTRKTSLLDAAVEVLKEAGHAMGTEEMLEQILEKKLWSTQGKTPAATLYAAILREIQK